MIYILDSSLHKIVVWFGIWSTSHINYIFLVFLSCFFLQFMISLLSLPWKKAYKPYHKIYHIWPWTTKPVIRVFLFFIIEIYTSSESWINISIDVWFVRIGKYLAEIQKGIEKIAFKVVQMKFIAMHITNQKLSFDIFMVGNVQNIFMEHDLYLIS